MPDDYLKEKKFRKSTRGKGYHPRAGGSPLERFLNFKAGPMTWSLFFLFLCVPMALFIGAVSIDTNGLTWAILASFIIIFISIFTRNYGGRNFYFLLISLSTIAIFVCAAIYLAGQISITSRNLIIAGIVFTMTVFIFYFLLSNLSASDKDIEWYLDNDFALVDYYNKMNKMKNTNDFQEALYSNKVAFKRFNDLYKDLELQVELLETNPSVYKSLDQKYKYQQGILSTIETEVFGDTCNTDSDLWRRNKGIVLNGELDRDRIPFVWCVSLGNTPIITQRMLFKDYLINKLPNTNKGRQERGKPSPKPTKDAAVVNVLRTA